MSKFWQVGIVSLSAIFLATPAQAVLLGPSVTARPNATDGSGNIGWVGALNEWKAPENGFITGFQYYKSEAQDAGNDGSLRLMILRLTAGTGLNLTTSSFQVVYVSGAINTTGLAPGIQTVSTGSPVAVQAGDFVGMFGRGISFDANNAATGASPISNQVRTIYANIPAENNLTLGAGASTSALTIPSVGNVFQVKSSGTWSANDYNWWSANGSRRVYSLAADFTTIPEPSSIALLMVGAITTAGIIVRRRKSGFEKSSG